MAESEVIVETYEDRPGDWFVKFQFGRKETTLLQYVMIALALRTIRFILTKMGFSKEKSMRFIDEIIRRFGLNEYMDRANDYIIRDEEWLAVRTSNDIDIAVDRFQNQTGFEPVEMAEVVITEVKEGETPLGGEMRATYDFVIREENKNN